MDFRGEESYPTGLDDTWAVLSDQQVAIERYEAAGHTDIEVLEWGPDGDGFVMETKRVVHLDLPGFAKKVLKPANTMIQNERWGPVVDGAREGSYTVEVQGAPVKISGTTRLNPDAAGGTRHQVQGQLDVKVPIVGGKIANWAGGDTQRELDAELTFNRQRLTP
jgi:hypothetical protein